jgi:rRNA maturation endonuclease Nob1
MAYVRCPSCKRIGNVVSQRPGPDLCPRCGDPLPLRRTVIPLSRYRRIARERERPRAIAA